MIYVAFRSKIEYSSDKIGEFFFFVLGTRSAAKCEKVPSTTVGVTLDPLVPFRPTL